MSKNLVIVESPAKARTLGKYLGRDFTVLASYGHVRDLLPKEGAVDPERGFEMKYRTIERNQKHVDQIVKAIRKADALYLATDPDREGEAISWHIHELLSEKGLLKDRPIHRIVFHEITRQAIEDALKNPRQMSMNLVNAQQARRALDYLVGFNLSPLLWKKIRRGLSAGRVQSPALRMIVEREIEIEAFQAREYWTLEALAAKDEEHFRARLSVFGGEKVSQFSITTGEAAHAAEQTILEAAEGRLKVLDVQKRQRRRNPAAPFITSTLQQEAARKLGFTAQRTMRTAQQLYEGVDVGQGVTGLITYMRTDSVNLAAEAVEELRQLIAERYGSERLPAGPQTYRTRSKNAQEAHEAIRPTSAFADPEQIRDHVSRDQYRLYRLIWQRTVACQMIHATIDTVGVDLAAGEGTVFRATGSTIVDPGFMAVYREGVDDGKDDRDQQILLPALAKGEVLRLEGIQTDQHFTEPPPRYTEASLIKALEEHGIGRPSTYATIIATLQQREYVTLEKKRFQPTDVGRVVNRFLTEHFSRYVDYEFTARLEDGLDEISRGEKEWIPLMEAFWEPFHRLVEEKDRTVQRKDVTQEALDETCPKCDKPLSIRLGRRGRFIGCTGFPDCDYTRNLGNTAEEEEQVQEEVEGRTCPTCGGALVIRNGRYGRFIGCSNYPECRFIEPLVKPADTGVSCPQCGAGTMLQRRSRRGRVFYSCSTYPKCDYAVWNEPVARSCPACEWPMMTIKRTRRTTELVCPQKACGHTEPWEAEADSEGAETGADPRPRQAHG